MSTGNTQVQANIEDKLNELHLNPVDRARALGAMRVAAEAVKVFEVLAAGVKRIAAAMWLKPTVRT